MDEDTKFAQELAGKRISRRELLEIAGKLGLGAAFAGPFLAACGGAGSATPAATSTTAATETASAAATEGTATTTASPTATQAEATGGQTAREKTFIIAYYIEGITIDPAIYWQGDVSTVMAGLYEKLATTVWHPEDDSVEILPQLAESWEISPDNKVLTFKLQKGVTFHDGEPYNAEAQKFAFERMMAMNEGPAYMLNDYVETMEAVDELTFKMTLKKPVATYMQYLAGFWGPSAALSPKAVKDHATDQDKWAKDWFNANAVGTGPYKLDEYTPKVQYVISKYDNFWRGWDGQHMDKVIHRIIPEMATQRLLLEKGDIDAIIQPIPAEDFKALQGKPGLVLQKTESMVLNVIQLNMQKAPTNDINVRRGLIYAFDYDAVINSIYGGLAIRNGTTYPKGYEGYRSDIELPKKDLEKAKKYFQDAGFTGELDCIYIESIDTARRIATMFQADLASIGVTLKVRPIAPATMFEMYAKPETGAHAVIFPWAPDNRDSFSIANILWHTKGGSNWCFYSKPEMDDLLDKVQGEADKAKRTKMYEDIDQMVRDDAAWIMIAQEVHGSAFRDYIKDYTLPRTWYWGVVPYDVYRG